MQTIELKVDYLDGTTVDVVTVAADYIAFETKFDKSISELGNNPRMTYMFYLAWHCLKRTKATELEFEAWAENVAMVGAVEDPKA